MGWFKNTAAGMLLATSLVIPYHSHAQSILGDQLRAKAEVEQAYLDETKGIRSVDSDDYSVKLIDAGTVYVWLRNPQRKNETLAIIKIKDLNGDRIVDTVQIEDWTYPFGEGEKIYRIDNVTGPQSVIRGPYTSFSEMENVPQKTVSDTKLKPYQKVFDRVIQFFGENVREEEREGR